MMEEFLEFLSLSQANIRYVVIGSVLLGACTGIIGCFTFLRKRALVGDAVAHSLLPGVALAFMVFQSKNPLILLVGALISGWISLVGIDFITRKSKIKADSAIGLVLSVFFGIGILLLTSIQHSGSAAQSGLDSFLFGKAASLIGADMITFTAVGVLLVIVVLLFYKHFMLISFDPSFAKAIGLPVSWLEFTLATITVLAIAVGIQAVGVVLMAAMLITPAAAARYWTDKLPVMLLLSAIFGGFAGFTGSYISYIAPSMPTGPWIVVVISMIAIFSLFFSPKKGMWSRYRSVRKNRMKVLSENILKAFYHLGEKDQNFEKPRTREELLSIRAFRQNNLTKGLSRLKRRGFLEPTDGHWYMTETGKEEGKRITRLHRLWELYLTKYLKIAPDHVHEDAEAIEHVITPEIEARLVEIMGFPNRDPHDSKIPE